MAATKTDAKRLLSMFTDLAAYWNELGKGNEEECLVLLDLVEKMRQQWLMAYNDNLGLKALVASLEKDIGTCREREKAHRNELTDARAQIASLLTQKQALETERNQLEEQADAVRSLLKDDLNSIKEDKREKLTVFMSRSRHFRHGLPVPTHKESFSLGDDADIDYDCTADSLEEQHHGADVSSLRNGKDWHRANIGMLKKRSRSKVVHHPAIAEVQTERDTPTQVKRTRQRSGDDATEQYIATTTLTVPPSGGGQPTAHLELKRKSLNRSFSEPHLGAPPLPSAPQPNAQHDRLNVPKMTSVGDLRSPAAVTSWASGTSIGSRRHQFSKNAFPLVPEYCDVCTKRVAFGKSILKCTDCRFICHVDCRDRAPVPCVPRTGTPKMTAHSAPRKIAEFVPDRPPMIPHLIIHLVAEVERRGLDMVGLYRVPGSEKEVSGLLTNFMTMRGVPNLTRIDDPATLTGCIKKFLGRLKEPLIPASSWSEFVKCAEVGCRGKAENSALERAIADLPMPNRDTLAYLIAHWQTVAENSDVNKMPLSNLSHILGPTVVGYSSAGTVTAQMMDELPQQEMVMSALLSLRRGFWLSLIDYESSVPLLRSGGGAGTRAPASPLTPDGPFDPSRSGFMAPTATPTTHGAARHERRYFPQPPWN